MMNTAASGRWHTSVRMITSAIIVLSLALSVWQPGQNALAAGPLTIQLITWHIAGLDSNKVTAGPNLFPVGARVCNTSPTETARNVTSTFSWLTNPVPNYINLRSGSLANYDDYRVDILPGQCRDFYYEIEITRDPAAFTKTRRFRITASADNAGLVSTPTPREIYVERLISQNRNSVNNILLDGVSVPAGGKMTLVIGGVYNITMVGATATQGYNQIETFLNIPNTYLEIIQVRTTYSASTIGSPTDRLYGDACAWDNNPDSLNYRACTIAGRAGGNISVTYTVRVLPGSNSVNQPLTSMIYDFSGSSFHYNADIQASVRFVDVIPPLDVEFSKAFQPSPAVAGIPTTLIFTLANPYTSAVNDIAFEDPLPAGMVVAGAPNASATGCGADYTWAPLPGQSTLAFSQGSIPAGGACTLKVDVLAAAAGVYDNLSGSLRIGDYDTGKTAAASLEVSAATGGAIPTSCAVKTIAVDYRMDAGGPAIPAPSLTGPNVQTASASAQGLATTALTNALTGVGNPRPAWSASGWPSAASAPNTATSPYVEFALDLSKYGAVEFNFDAAADNGNGPGTAYVYTSADGGATLTSRGTLTSLRITSWAAFASPVQIGSDVSRDPATPTLFRIYGVGANSHAGNIYLDNFVVAGCTIAPPPTVSKSFSPAVIAAGGGSTLSFTIANMGAGAVAQSGVTFTDPLPAGLNVANSTSSVCGGTNNLVVDAATRTITLTGANLAASGAGSTCTFSVPVTATEAGTFENISGYIASNEYGTNTAPPTGSPLAGGYARASLTALLPPVISKSFSPDLRYTGIPTTLVITISNPNQFEPLSGIAFVDTYPANLKNASPLTPGDNLTNTCGGTLTAAAGGGSLSLADGLLAPGQACQITVDVVGLVEDPSGASYVNVTGAVSAAVAGVGNTATDQLAVYAPVPALGFIKQVSAGEYADPAERPWSRFVAVRDGDPVYYRFVVENLGEVRLTNLSVVDPGLDVSGCAWDELEPYESVTCTASATASAGAGPGPWTFDNTAYAQGTYTAPDSATTLVTTPESTASYQVVSPAFSFAKEVAVSAAGPWATAISNVPASSGQVYYRFTFTNTGDVALTALGLDDPLLDTAACAFDTPLPVAAATSCVVGPVSAATGIGVYTNTAAATGRYYNLAAPGAAASASYATQGPDLRVTKTSSAAAGAYAGYPFTWSLQVENAAGADVAVFPLGAVILRDALPLTGESGPLYGPVTVTPGAAAPGGTGEVSCAIAAGELTCTAIGGEVSLTGGAAFTAAFQVTPRAAGALDNPRPGGTCAVDPGEVVTESNESDNTCADSVSVSAITLALRVAWQGARLNDAVEVAVKAGADTLGTFDSVANAPDETDSAPAPVYLRPGQTVDLSQLFTTGSASDYAASLVCTGAADDDPSDGLEISALDSAITCTFTNTRYQPALSVTKTVTSTPPYAVGDVITYSIRVENTGGVSLTGVTVTDPQAGSLACSAELPAVLEPGASLTCTAGYTVTQADLDAGSFTNTATAASDQAGPVADSAPVYFPPAPAITLEKTALPGLSSPAVPGDTITYTLTATNTGNVTLRGVAISDALLPALDCAPAQPAELAPGESLVCQGSYAITQANLDAGQVTNNAAVASRLPDDTSGPAHSAETVTPLTPWPALALEKTVDQAMFYAAGDRLVFTIRARNTGNVALRQVAISDPALGELSCAPAQPAELAPGEALECSGEYTVSAADVAGQSITNTAGATATAATGEEINESAQASATLAEPGISLVETVAEDSFSAAGDLLHITLLARNTGNVRLTGVTITHALEGVICTPPMPAALDPGEEMECQGVYTVTAADLSAGAYTHQSAVTGVAPNGGGVEAQAESEVPSIPVGYTIYLPLVGASRSTAWNVTLAYEDLPLNGRNDYDYNDWVVHIQGASFADGDGLVREIDMRFTPLARGAILDHRFSLRLPAALLTSDGTAILTLYDASGAVLKTEMIQFSAGTEQTLVIFPSTRTALPGNQVNTFEHGAKSAPQRSAALKLVFDQPVAAAIDESRIGLAHGSGLFFDPQLFVPSSLERVRQGDLRLASVPSGSWRWPEEGVRVDKAYPQVVFTPGAPPSIQFPAAWWTVFNDCVYNGKVCSLP